MSHPDARPHMLRHYFAQSRLDAGWKLTMIANALRHTDAPAVIDACLEQDKWATIK